MKFLQASCIAPIHGRADYLAHSVDDDDQAFVESGREIRTRAVGQVMADVMNTVRRKPTEIPLREAQKCVAGIDFAV
ncbi:MAG: hypothetical protein K2Q25_00665 [Mycobacteriaceae bacterium]|nr:hypothetical protein [Mycobacteriaceae bacterium]